MVPPAPRISVILPVHNAAAYLVEAVESIRCQSLPDWEMHVIDDGSADDSAAILGRFAAAEIDTSTAADQLLAALKAK